MIQRIQSIFLVIAALSFGLLFQFPFASLEPTQQGVFADGRFDIFDNPLMMVLTGLGFLLSVAALFFYKNRTVQLRLTYLVIIMSVLILTVSVFIMLNQGAELPENAQPNDEIGLYVPIISIVLAAFAVRFINKDEKLVKSMDRLR